MPERAFLSVLSDDEITALAHTTVGDLAGRLTRHAFQEPRDNEATERDAVRREALAQLRLLTHIQTAVEAHMLAAAARAADAGAGYPQLGGACRITRQGARRRWPGIVPADTDASTDPRGPGPRPDIRRSTL